MMSVFTEVTDDVSYVGYHKIDSKVEQTYQILVRPDVTEECVLTLAQQILITYGGQVARHVQSLEDTGSIASAKFTSSKSSERSTPEGLLKEHSRDAKSTSASDQDTQEKPQSPYLESVNSSPVATASVPWQSMRIYLGVNMDLQRCILFAVKPMPSAAGNNSASSVTDARQSARAVTAGIFAGIGVNTFSALNAVNSIEAVSGVGGTSASAAVPYISTVRRSFLEFCDNVASELNTAMREESLTLDYMSSVPANMTGPMQGVRYSGYGAGLSGSGSGAGSRAPDSVIDVPFVRDLHCATVQLMVRAQVLMCTTNVRTEMCCKFERLDCRVTSTSKLVI
jgi:hypothetical protein